MRNLTTIAILIAGLLLSGCSDDSGTPSSIPAANTEPVAEAGPDQTVIVGTLVALDGTASSDADDDALTCAWTVTSQPDGSVAVLSDASTVGPSITPDVDGTYTVQLIVNDGELDSAPSTVTITANLPPSPWSALEQIVSMDDVTESIMAVNHPVPVRFDADTLHLYFSGVAFKTYAVVPAYIYRITSDDNGDTWSAPERLAQLEGNYQSYPVGYYDGKLLIVWHDGTHAELHHTALASAAATPAAPTLYVDYASAGKEVIGLSMWNQTMLGMWHSSSTTNNSPFTGEMGAATAALSAVASPFTGTFYHATLMAVDRAIVLLNDTSLLTADFDGTSLENPVTLEYPEADVTLEYNGDTFYHAQFEQWRGDVYFIGYDSDLSRSGVYRVQLLD